MNTKKIIVIINVALIMVIMGWQVFAKEKTLKHGTLVLLRLAPKDPRSLMQGDFMRLRYEEVRDMDTYNIPTRGYMIMRLDSGNIGKLVRVSEKADSIQPGEIPIKYFYNESFVSIGAESFFFEEGSATKFDSARYGGLRVAPDGTSILTGLYDENKKYLEP